jgi:hypothetical protein
MTEHEQLKEICDKIGYMYNVSSDTFVDFDNNIISIREIIFTQEFMDKLFAFLLNKHTSVLMANTKKQGLLKNLDNPTEYLYNLIK